VRREQDGVTLKISRADARLFEASTVGLRSAHIIDDGPEKLKRVATVTSEGFKQTIARSADGFSLEVPSGFKADGLQSENLFDALGRLDAERWVSEKDDGSFGLQSPRFTVSVDLSGDKGVVTRKLLIGAKSGDGSYARLEPDTGVFVLDKTVEDSLSNWVIDRSVFMVEPDDVESIQIEWEGKKTQIVASDGDWKTSADSGVSLGEEPLSHVRAILAELRAEGVMHIGAAKSDEGFDNPSLRMVVRLKSGKGAERELRMSVGAIVDWRTIRASCVRREGVNATYAIDSSKLTSLVDALTGKGEGKP
jgi:hypothetical protein